MYLHSEMCQQCYHHLRVCERGRNRDDKTERKQRRVEEGMCIVILKSKKINGILKPRKEEAE